VVLQTLAQRSRFGRVVLVAGARTPQHFLFLDEAGEWTRSPLFDAQLIVDTAGPDWGWQVGLVTEPLRRLTLDPMPLTLVVVQVRAV
jgi:NAD(P)H-flavin reductase